MDKNSGGLTCTYILIILIHNINDEITNFYTIKLKKNVERNDQFITCYRK